MGWERKISWTFPPAVVPGSSGSFLGTFALKVLFARSRVQPWFTPRSFGKTKPKLFWEQDITGGPLGLPAPCSQYKHGGM